MTLDDADLDALVEKARAATKGPWWWTKFGTGASAVYQDYPDAYDPHEVEVASRVERPADAAYIAAASPDVTLALVARLKAAEAETTKWYDKHLDGIAFANEQRARAEAAEQWVSALEGQIRSLVTIHPEPIYVYREDRP